MRRAFSGRRRGVGRAFAALCAAGALVAGTPAQAATFWGPFAAPSPALGPQGSATMHADAGSSDATPLAGPGARAVRTTVYPLAAACPTLLQGSDGMVVALCTTIAGRTPTVELIDPNATGALASASATLPLVKGGLLGGVYAYLDNANRLVPAGDSVVGLVPDPSGGVWFATEHAVAGRVDPSGHAAAITLGGGEMVENSISATPDGRIAVATTHALYELRSVAAGHPEVLWRKAYDRGPGRKPGQLSWGTGSTPVYFGPETGADYVAIVDNAAEAAHLLVFRSGTGQLVCVQPVLTRGGPGSENAPIGLGRTVVVASTYGYPYPTLPQGAGPAVPPMAPFTGGMTRVDVGASGCHTVWDNEVRSSAVPMLSAPDGLIYTVNRIGPAATTPLDGFEFTAVNADTGAIAARSPLPGTIVADPLQTAPLITRDRRVLQGTLSGIVRIG
ncbi:hypothetical protein [Nocardia miyunensis]|uniref:hypothetical protein n=1 Tax=Nocardia miyunensis TaxID=282684 RepID=UPI00082D08FB|nr:hypothetical protein [Nocardia miyunensis]